MFRREMTMPEYRTESVMPFRQSMSADSADSVCKRESERTRQPWEISHWQFMEAMRAVKIENGTLPADCPVSDPEAPMRVLKAEVASNHLEKQLEDMRGEIRRRADADGTTFEEARLAMIAELTNHGDEQ